MTPHSPPSKTCQRLSIMMSMSSGASCKESPMFSSSSCKSEELVVTKAAGNAARAARGDVRRKFNNNNANTNSNLQLSSDGGVTTVAREDDGTNESTTTPEEQPKALIAKIGLFLMQTWNWLHNFFVTILFLGLVNVEKTTVPQDLKTVEELSSQNQEVQEERIIWEEDKDNPSEVEDEETDNDVEKDVVEEQQIVKINAGEKTLAQEIVSQVEAMFSDEHLVNDGFLLKHVRRRLNGFVSLKLLAGFPKVKKITQDFPQFTAALRDSKKLEINPEGTKIRRIESLPESIMVVPIKGRRQGSGKGHAAHGSSNRENQLPKTIYRQNNITVSGYWNNSSSGNYQSGNENRRQSAPPHYNGGGSQPRRNSNGHRHPYQNNYESSVTSTADGSNDSFGKSPPSFSSYPDDLQYNGCSSVVTCMLPAEKSKSPKNSSSLEYRARPKSKSYFEGGSSATMCSWLQRRRASASATLSSSELVYSGVVRQPRGPDGTVGFASGYRDKIRKERTLAAN